MSEESVLPRYQISSIATGGAVALQQFRESTRDIFDVIRPGTAGDYAIDMQAVHMGNLLLSDLRSSAQGFQRSRAMVATAGIDHLMVQLYTHGGFAGLADTIDVRVRAGDVCIFDLTRTLETRAGDYGNITLVIPRPLLEDKVADIDSLHGLVLDRDLPLTQILAAHIRTLAQHAAGLAAGDAAIASRGTIQLLASLVDQRPGNKTRATAMATPLREVLRYIHGNLHDSALGPTQVAQECGVSRATLYRMFEQSGGVAEFIRERRLSGAAMDLASPSAHPRRISDIARSWGFADDSSFSRAFRSHFGISPSEARTASARTWARAQWGGLSDQDSSAIAYWIRMLHE
ncbi:helix-turn-helix domain-containing protein [Sphingomonas suaedae]|uniref:Helix-turn-helix domain-containing protein n=1 Tax=Sphingomonas suaedae TaxID=2599297 RepID=A0A518RC10_9SPHN|nr:helix-turn-helix domain-containing protein [Sphingomonas suaedae]QDX25002.1 helix-turn-helix domain-containing protein [Sphingomonas suaedae]